MPRPRLNPTIRFADVLPILESALLNGGGTYECDNPREAIHILHRLNTARKALRDSDAEGICPYDRFTIATEGAVIRLAYRTSFRPERFKPPEDELP